MSKNLGKLFIIIFCGENISQRLIFNRFKGNSFIGIFHDIKLRDVTKGPQNNNASLLRCRFQEIKVYTVILINLAKVEDNFFNGRYPTFQLCGIYIDIKSTFWVTIFTKVTWQSFNPLEKNIYRLFPIFYILNHKNFAVWEFFSNNFSAWVIKNILFHVL